MKKWRDIKHLIELLQSERDEIDVRLEALRKTPECLEDEILLKYIETRSTVKAAEYVKSKGIRSARGTVYSAAGLSALIREGSSGVDQILLRIAREIFEKNTKAVVRAYG